MTFGTGSLFGGGGGGGGPSPPFSGDAIDVTYTPAGNVSSTNLQAAVTELDTKKAPIASPTFTGTPAAPTAAGGTNTTQVATTAFVAAAVAALVASSPGALDTLNELAAALGNDASFSATVTSALAAKAPLAAPALTGIPTAPTAISGTNTTQLATTAFVFAERAATVTLTNKTLTSPTLTGTPIAPTPADGTNTTQIATTAFVQSAVALLVASSPTALDTLNELAAALGNDANFSATLTTSLSLKAPLASPTFTGTPAAPTASAATNTTQVATTAFVFAERANTATLTNKTLASPTLTGTPVAPTATPGTANTQIATTAFVDAALSGVASLVDGSTTAVINTLNPSGMKHGSVVLLQGAASQVITGLTALNDGDVVTIVNDSDDYVKILANEYTGSVPGTTSAANRLTLPKSFPAFLMPNDFIVLTYSTRTSRWRVLTWANQGLAMGLTEFTDFVGNIGPFQTSTNSGTITNVNTGADTTELAMGITSINTGATSATGRASVGSASIGNLVPRQAAMLAVSRNMPIQNNSGTQQYAFYFGFQDAMSGTLTDAICWENRWTGSAEEWNCLGQAAGTPTRVAGPALSNSEFMWQIIFVNPAGTRADFFYSFNSLDFIKQASISTNLPAAANVFAFGHSIVKSVGTTDCGFRIDLAGYRYDAAANRG